MPAQQAIDLRSDTVTRPTAEMRRAIAEAPVGDDQYGEDDSTNSLQAHVAELLGKEAALWLPSGTMANQVALKVLTKPGDEVVVGREVHIVWHELGASAIHSGVQFREVGSGGLFSAVEVLEVLKPRGHSVYPATTMVEIENSHNRGGGVVFPQDEVERICAAAREHDVASYLDGARLWNAAVASGRSPAELAAPFDLAMVALSKGLGAPGGSMLVGSAERIERARRFRRMFGGAMRQTGHYAAAALYALEHHLERLADDHTNARVIAERLLQSEWIVLDPATVQTNILVFDLAPGAPDAAALLERARERGVVLNALGARRARVVTHLQVSREQCERAAEILVEIAEGVA